MLGLTATPPGSLTRTPGRADAHPVRADPLRGQDPGAGQGGHPRAVRRARLADRAHRRRGRLAARAVDPVPGADHRPLRPCLRVDAAPGVAGSAVRRSPTSDGTSTWQEIAAREPGDRRRGAAPGPRRPPGAAARGAPPRAAPPAAGGRGLAALPGRLAADAASSRGARSRGSRVRATAPSWRPYDARCPPSATCGPSTGIRTGRGTVDRVTARSAAKQDAVTGIVSSEATQPRRARAGPGPVRPRARHRHHACAGHRRRDPAAGAGRVGDRRARRAARRPGLCRPRPDAGDRQDRRRRGGHAADDWSPGSTTPIPAWQPASSSTPAARCRPLSGRWTSGQWVAHVTGFFAAGGTRALVGTRGLLGEGWDAPAITTLVDLTTATTPTAVVQTRGRALRIDPANPEKVALLWSVVCVQEGHVAGANDWERYARKHRGYFTVDETGAGRRRRGRGGLLVQRLPPAGGARLPGLDARMLVRGEGRDVVRDRWLSGAAYSDRVEHVVRVLPDKPVPTEAIGAASRAPRGSSPWPEQARLRPAAGRRPCPSSPCWCCSSPSSDRRSPLPWSCSPCRSARCPSPCSVAAGCAPPASTAPPSGSSPRRWPTGCRVPASRPSAPTA